MDIIKSTYSGVEGELSTITYSKNDLMEDFLSSLVKKIDKEEKKRKKVTHNIERNDKKAIYEALNAHFSDDFDLDFTFAHFSKKYFVTDKSVLFSITPFFRGFKTEEKTSLIKAQKKYEEVKGQFDIEKVKKD